MKLNKTIIILAGLFSLNASCPGPKPPTPIPTPTPTPSPIPPSYDNNRVLRTSGTSLTTLNGKPFHLDLGVQCCDAIPGVSNSRWPLASEGVIDYYKQSSLNAIAFRLGPFYGTPDYESEWSDIGGPFTGNPPEITGIHNQAFDSKVVSIVQYAYNQNFWILVDIIDTWYCKHASSKQGFNDTKMPWPQSDIDSCGIAMTPVQEEYLRHWVKLLGIYPNIIWHSDIEGSLIRGFNCSWWYSQYDIIRDEEKKNSYPVHIIGSNNSSCPDKFEFSTTHDRNALLAPINGKFTINDERNPAFPPNQEINNFKQARDLGLSYAFWRAGMSDSDMETTLAGFKSIINGATPIVGCYAPDAEDPLWDPTPIPRSGFTPDGNSKAGVNTCRNTLGPMTGEGHDKMLLSMAACLRDAGFCASKSSDAVMLKRTDSKNLYEEYHVVAYSDDTWATNDQVLPKMLWTYNGDSPQGDCHGDVATVDNVACKLQQAYGLIDCTPRHGSQPIRPETDPERTACEQKAMESLGGYPKFLLSSDTLTLRLTPNPLQVIAENKGTGILTCSFPKATGNFCNPSTQGLKVEKP